MIVERLGEVITSNSIPPHIPNDNINGPTVFERPSFFPAGPKWLMYFSHHKGLDIRQATSDSLEGPWTVLNETVLELNKTPGHDHLASPEVVIKESEVEIYYHTPYQDWQYTFKASTVDGINWSYDSTSKGMFYLRFLEHDYALAKYKNSSAILYKCTNEEPQEIKRILPNMRHCAYLNGKLYWTTIGDAPEHILRGDFNYSTLEVDNIETVLTPTEDFETGRHPITPSRSGAAVRVNQVRDPFVISDQTGTYLFYTVRGEEAIAVARIKE